MGLFSFAKGIMEQTIPVVQLEVSASYQLADSTDGGVGHRHYEGLQRL